MVVLVGGYELVYIAIIYMACTSASLEKHILTHKHFACCNRWLSVNGVLEIRVETKVTVIEHVSKGREREKEGEDKIFVLTNMMTFQCYLWLQQNKNERTQKQRFQEW